VDGMDSACKDHVDDIGPKGQTGSKGSDDSTPELRFGNYGMNKDTLAESLTYGVITGVDVMMKLVIDDGNEKREQR